MPFLTIAAPSFLVEGFLPLFASRTTLVVRGLRVPPVLVPKLAAEGLLDAAVSIGVEGLQPKGWSSERVGDVHYGLFGSPVLAGLLGKTPSQDDIRAVPFVTPVFVSRDGILERSVDGCPLPLVERKVAHEVETIGLACQVAALTDHLVYGPLVAAAPLIREGRLVEIEATEFRRVDPLFLACNETTVAAIDHDALAETLREVFATVRHASAIVSVSPSATVRRLLAK